jgi:glycerate dehydrogenase
VYYTLVMKFKKALAINIDKGLLEKYYWEKIDKLVEKRVHLPKDSPKIFKEIIDADCVLVNFGTPVTKEMIDAAPNLKYIGVLATAYGKIDIEHARKKGIPVSNLAGYSTESVAEFVFAALLDELRRVEEGKKRGRSGNYSELGLKASEIKGKVFGVIGLGNIGSRVAEIALGFSADVRYWSRTRKNDREQKGIKYEELDSLIASANILSINLAETEETREIMSHDRFKKLKQGAVVINTAPMELIELDGLEERLKKDDITFIFDHSDEFAPEYMKRFSKYNNFIIYPPIAYITKEAAKTKQEMFVGNMKSFLDGNPQNVVN